MRILFALLLMTKLAFGSHMVGADIGYKCLGGQQYSMILDLYCDCSGINAPLSVTLTVSSFCSSYIYVPCGQVNGTGAEIPSPFPAVTTCQGGTVTGIRHFRYEGSVTLPPCANWNISYAVCCRNPITTVINSTGTTFYIDANLDNTNGCNDSPIFNTLPVPFICLGDQVCLDFGAVDPDGDSLVYTLWPPRQAPNSYVPFVAPYSEINPIASASTTFDKSTGELCVDPQMIQVGVTAVRIDEWRNGVFVGSTTREIQLIVIDCSPFSLPVIISQITVKYVPDFDIARIGWTTVSEINCNYFEIWKIKDDQWTYAATVKGHGTSSERHDYFWIDAHPANYYKLRQVDYNGDYHDSQPFYIELPDPPPCIRYTPDGRLVGKWYRGTHYIKCGNRTTIKWGK